jgi:hypothetical protein
MQVGELPVEALPVVLELITSGEPHVYPALNLLHFASFHPRLLSALLQLEAVQVRKTRMLPMALLECCEFRTAGCACVGQSTVASKRMTTERRHLLSSSMPAVWQVL